MTAKTATKTTKSKASTKSKSTAKPKPAASAKPKAAAKTAAPKKTTKAKGSAKSTAAKGGAAKNSAAKGSAAKGSAAKGSAAKAAAAADPIDSVKPLIKVRQAREFTTRKVTKAELDAITEVARWSGSSRNEQPCRFVALRDKDLIRDIAEMGLPQTRGLPTATAAVVIVEPDEPERADSRAFDDGRAAERMLVAAHMLGLGGGISRVRPDVRDGINKALNLPANRSVRTIVAFGHPTEDALESKSKPGKARLPREEVIYEDRWPDQPLKD